APAPLGTGRGYRRTSSARSSRPRASQQHRATPLCCCAVLIMVVVCGRQTVVNRLRDVLSRSGALMRTTVALFVLIVGASSPGLGQSLRGTWKPVEIVVDSGPDRGRHTTDVQPGLLIFTRDHYSMTFVQGFKARAV